MFGIGFVCWLGYFCLALGLSVCLFFVGITLGIGFVCLFVGWVTYVWYCVCLLFVAKLCWALGLSVCSLGDLCLVTVGLFGTSTAD